MAPLSGKSPSEMKATRWMLVHWLTEGRTREGFDALVQNMPSDWAVEGQVEQGEGSDGKLHLQLYLKTPQCRGTKITKYFPGTTIDEARNGFALQNYVHKEETRVGEFKTVENRSPQWHVVRDKFYEWYVDAHADQLGHRVDDEEKVKYWDYFIGLSLEEGMNVDVLGVNPQYRSCIMKYWTHMIRRTLAARQQRSVDKCLDKTKDDSSGIAELQSSDPVAGGGSPVRKKTVKVCLPKE